MSIELNVVITLIISAAITTLTGFIITRIMNKRAKKEERLTQLEDKEQKEKYKREFIDAVKEEIKPLREGFLSMSQDISKIKDGTLSTLRNDILECYYDCNKKGYRNDYDYTNIHNLYEAYKRLDGNSFITDIMKRFDTLPTKEEFKSKRTKKPIMVKEGE